MAIDLFRAGNAFTPNFGSTSAPAIAPTSFSAVGGGRQGVSSGVSAGGFSSGVSAGGASGGGNPVSSGVSAGRASGGPSTSSTRKSTRSSGTTNTRENTSEARTSQQQGNALNITPEALAKLHELIAGVQQNPLLQSIDAGRQRAIAEALGLVQDFSIEDIMARASGDVADLERRLREEIVPEISGISEESGTGVNALTALLAQDATARTSEAQARIREQARGQAAQEQVNNLRALNETLGVGSETVATLNDLINTAKGTIQQSDIVGTESTVGSSTGQTNQSATSEEVGNAQSGGGGGGDALALALLQSSLSPFQSLQDLTMPGAQGAVLKSQESLNALLSRLRSFV